MKRTLPWIVAGVLLSAVLDAAAQNPEPAGPSPWRLDKVSKLLYAPDDEPSKGAVDSPAEVPLFAGPAPAQRCRAEAPPVRITDPQGRRWRRHTAFTRRTRLWFSRGIGRTCGACISMVWGNGSRSSRSRTNGRNPSREGLFEQPKEKSPPPRTGRKPAAKSRTKGKGGASGSGGGGSGWGGGSVSGGSGGGEIAGGSGASGARNRDHHRPARRGAASDGPLSLLRRRGRHGQGL